VDGVVSSRPQALEVPHVDLDAGYGYEQWPSWFVAGALPRAVATLGGPAALAGLCPYATDTGTPHPLGTRTERTVRGPANAPCR
jgi:maleylpyruvate isomerase